METTIKPELVEELLKSVSKPEELLGPGGMLHRLTRWRPAPTAKGDAEIRYLEQAHRWALNARPCADRRRRARLRRRRSRATT